MNKPYDFEAWEEFHKNQKKIMEYFKNVFEKKGYLCTWTGQDLSIEAYGKNFLMRSDFVISRGKNSEQVTSIYNAIKFIQQNSK